jgi:tetratricopeptide (TPR) repeat protein
MAVSAVDRVDLVRILNLLSISDIAVAVDALDAPAELKSLRVWTDLADAVDRLTRLPETAGVPPLVAFVDQLILVAGGAAGTELRAWRDRIAPGRSEAPPAESARRPRRISESGLIWGGVPIRNRNFTGRVEMLDRLGQLLRERGTRTAVLPQTLQGLGGVGKTQLVVEYVYRHANEYDLVWWIPAEQTATVLTSLTELAGRLDLEIAQNSQSTAQTVLAALAGSDLEWLLVYDNADDPSLLNHLLPSTGAGNVIVTTRIPEWNALGDTIEVDVFQRAESIELLQKRSRDEHGRQQMDTGDADDLADRLGDLPLALEQAAAWFLATGMPVREYIELLDSQSKELLDEGRPASYPLTVAAFVRLAIEKLREDAPAGAQLLAMFAFLGSEPTPLRLLRSGAAADVAEPLHSVLGDSIAMNRAVRELTRFGLSKLDPQQRIQVHRLVQRVLLDTLPDDLKAQTLRDVQNVLAAANPGDPDEHGELDRQREMGPHLRPAGLIRAANIAARQAVLDHARYLYISGDYENSLTLAREASQAWAAEGGGDPRMGPDGEFTLLARAQVANATRALGDSSGADQIIQDTYQRLRNSPLLGPRHEFTLITGNQVGHQLRIAGRYSEALDFDRESVALHRLVFGNGETYTLRALVNLAVDYRMIGEFGEALKLDTEIVDYWEDSVGVDARGLRAQVNLARDFYGMGAYPAALDLLDRLRPRMTEVLGPAHGTVLSAMRTYGVTLRKAGRRAEAAEFLRENREQTRLRFPKSHEFTVAATVSYANALRDIGQIRESAELLIEATELYRADFGEDHPLTLVAQVNEAIARRALGEPEIARQLDEHCFERLELVLGAEHPYTLCACASLATDYSLLSEHSTALRLSQLAYTRGRPSYGVGQEIRGGDHPYVLARAINLAQDLAATGDREAAAELREASLSGLRATLGAAHPEVVAAEEGHRVEGDIEPPPT